MNTDVMMKAYVVCCRCVTRTKKKPESAGCPRRFPFTIYFPIYKDFLSLCSVKWTLCFPRSPKSVLDYTTLMSHIRKMRKCTEVINLCYDIMKLCPIWCTDNLSLYVG